MLDKLAFFRFFHTIFDCENFRTKRKQIELEEQKKNKKFVNHSNLHDFWFFFFLLQHFYPVGWKNDVVAKEIYRKSSFFSFINTQFFGHGWLWDDDLFERHTVLQREQKPQPKMMTDSSRWWIWTNWREIFIIV